MDEKRIAAGSTKKKRTVVQLTPTDSLEFDLSDASGKQVSATLVIKNPTEDSVCFKVKTTAPTSYCVRPNSGLLKANDSIDISVILQKLPKEGEVCKDKFLVQTMLAKDVEDTNSPSMWKDAPKAQIMESKLKCIWKTSPAVEIAPATAAAETLEKVEKDKSVPAPPTKTSSVTQQPTSSPARTTITSTSSDAKAVSKKDKGASAAVATSVATPKTEMPALMLLLGVFVLGYIFGKFVL